VSATPHHFHSGLKKTRSSLRKERKIRPGFTPQEDVRRFRGTKQAQLDARQLPKGHIIGWAPPPTSASSTSGKTTGTTLSKSQKKNQKRKEKRENDVSKKIKDSWEDDDDDEDDGIDAGNKGDKASTPSEAGSGSRNDRKSHIADRPNAESDADGLADKLGKLEVQ